MAFKFTVTGKAFFHFVAAIKKCSEEILADGIKFLLLFLLSDGHKVAKAKQIRGDQTAGSRKVGAGKERPPNAQLTELIPKS